jgi:hypothetical protein
LIVKHVGEYSPHDVALKAGFKKGDRLISFDGRDDWRSETDLIVYSLRLDRKQRSIKVVVERSEKRVTIEPPRSFR